MKSREQQTKSADTSILCDAALDYLLPPTYNVVLYFSIDRGLPNVSYLAGLHQLHAL